MTVWAGPAGAGDPSEQQSSRAMSGASPNDGSGGFPSAGSTAGWGDAAVSGGTSASAVSGGTSASAVSARPVPATEGRQGGEPLDSDRVLELLRDERDGSRARRFVAEHLLDSGLDELADDALVATSELVTNALIHTDGPVTVTVLAGQGVARVAVEDASPIPPVAGVLDETALQGRGLVIVARLSARWGVDPSPRGGKVVWFEVQLGQPSAPEDLDPEALLQLWSFEVGPEPVAASTGEVRRVRLPDVRADLLHGAKSHLDDLVRESTLLAHSAGPALREEAGGLAVRLTDLAVRLVGFRNQVRRQALLAGSRPDVTITLELELPVSLRPALAEYRDALDDADSLCEQGLLLACADDPEHQRFRRWKLDRIIEQLG